MIGVEIADRIWRPIRGVAQRYVELNGRAFEVLRSQCARLPWVPRFNDWANGHLAAWEAERSRRLNAPLVAALRDAGLHEQAERLERL